MIELEADVMMNVAQAMGAFREKFKSTAESKPSRQPQSPLVIVC